MDAHSYFLQVTHLINRGKKPWFFYKWHISWAEQSLSPNLGGCKTKRKESIFLFNNQISFVDSLSSMNSFSPSSRHQISITWITNWLILMMNYIILSLTLYLCLYLSRPPCTFPSYQTWWHGRQIIVRALVLEPHPPELASCVYSSLWPW